MFLTHRVRSVVTLVRNHDRLTGGQQTWERRSKNHRIFPSKYFACMPKRPRQDPADEKEDSFSEVPSDDDQEPDVFAALTGQKKRRISGFEEQIPGEREDDDEDLQDIIRQATAKRDVKEGTQVVKKVKGKTKITKGEVGGGSFQSMGERSHPCRALLSGLRSSAQVSTLPCCVL
jgi:ATP-dependent RNA helicase DDX54/DBP10